MKITEKIPELACPVCKGGLEEAVMLNCRRCGRGYEVHDGIAHMIGGDMVEFVKEIAVQDRVAIEYQQKRYQEPYAKRYHQWWTQKMLSMVNTAGRILDNGCGIGLLNQELPVERVVGLDLSSEMLRHASRHSDQLVLGNSQQLPFRDGGFDLVFCRSILHHLPNPQEAVKEMYRVLKPGGEVVLVETNASILSTIPRKIANRGEHFSQDHRNMNREILKDMFEPYFRIDEVSYFGYIAYPLLGFPDLVNIFRRFPFKGFFEAVLMGIDKTLACIPLIKTQSWAIMLKGTRL